MIVGSLVELAIGKSSIAPMVTDRNGTAYYGIYVYVKRKATREEYLKYLKSEDIIVPSEQIPVDAFFYEVLMD